jgi:hypothetical protein
MVTMIRTTDSGGLKAILQIDDSYSPTAEDVQCKSLEVDFASDAVGKMLPATLELVLESPGFDPASQRKKIRVPPVGDSDVAVFMIKPKRLGPLRLNLQVRSADVEIGSRMLLTTSVPGAAAQQFSHYGMASLPLKPAIGQTSITPKSSRRFVYWSSKTTFVVIFLAAALALFLPPFRQARVQPPARIQSTDIYLRAYRGADDVQVVPTSRPLDVYVDATDEPDGPVDLQLVDSIGALVWKGQANIQHERLAIKIPRIDRPGRYFLRIYKSAKGEEHELLLEYPIDAR